MGVLVLDVIVVYLFKALRRMWGWRGTSAWVTRYAKITSIFCDSNLWGCPTVEVAYSYDVDGKTYWRSESIPFLCDSSAKGYLYRNPEGNLLKIRVNPNNPEMSVTTTDMVT